MAKNESNNNNNNNDEFKVVDDEFPEPWKDMEEEDFIVGKYLGTLAINSNTHDEPFTVYKVKTDDGLMSVSGASLEARMKTIPIGSRIKVIFKGTEKSKHGTPMKMFEVLVAKNVKLLNE